MQVVESVLMGLRSRGFNITERDLCRILRAYSMTDDFWKGVGISEVPVSYVVEVLKELQRAGALQIGDTIELTPEGHKLCIRKCVLYPENPCESCGGRGIELDDRLKGLYRSFVEVSSDRPDAVKEYDQAYVTPETTIYRVAIALYRGDIAGRKVVVLGDDDLVSVAISMLGVAEEVAVVEVDKRLIDFIRDIKRKLDLSLSVFQFDLSDGIPREMRARFDTFFTDPPETEDALMAFVGCGIDTLRGEGSAGYFGVTRQESSLFKWRRFQRRLLKEYDVVITDIIKNFSEYVAWGYGYEKQDIPPLRKRPDVNWFYSYLYRIELLSDVGRRAPYSRIVYQDRENSILG